MEERDDEMMLPFFKPLWDRVVQDTSAAKADSWKSAKANMLALAQAILLSPDFTDSQKLALIDKYQEQMKVWHKVGQNAMRLGPDQAAALDDVRAQTIGMMRFNTSTVAARFTTTSTRATRTSTSGQFGRARSSRTR